MNGSSVPRQGEVLITTARCNHFRFEEPLTVTVGAGACVWDVNETLRTFGYELPLLNDGGASGPSLGGYVSAGGIGAGAWLEGGFWETVAELVLLTGSGEVLRCTPDHPVFRWVFGSMGQLGLITELKLRIQPSKEAPVAVYPLGVAGEVVATSAEWPDDVWLTLFVPEDALEPARDQLRELQREHSDAWVPREDYAYFMRSVTFNPPLVYPHQGSFFALGIWGTVSDLNDVAIARLRHLERDFAALVKSEPTYRRYIQAELAFDDAELATYFGEDILREFRNVKRDCDPNMLLGRGVFS